MRPTPKLTTFAIAIAHSAPVCLRCVLRPKAPKTNKKKRTHMAGFEPVTANARKKKRPPATGPLQAGFSWPDQKMGSFGFFLYTNNFLRRKSFFGCPPSVAGGTLPSVGLLVHVGTSFLNRLFCQNKPNYSITSRPTEGQAPTRIRAPSRSSCRVGWAGVGCAHMASAAQAGRRPMWERVEVHQRT